MLSVLVTAQTPLKVDGVIYNVGDEFPFDPQNENHRLLWFQRRLKMTVAEPEPEPEPEPKAVKRGPRSQ
jgi:hypothetical protein